MPKGNIKKDGSGMEFIKKQELSEIARKIRVGIVESTNAAG